MTKTAMKFIAMMAMLVTATHAALDATDLATVNGLIATKVAAAEAKAADATTALQGKLTSLKAELAKDEAIIAMNKIVAANATADLITTTAAIAASDAATKAGVDTFWTLLAAFMVFFMQAGFGMLEVGSVRAKNHQNILIKNVVDAAVGGLAFWLVGYAFAFGTTNTNDADGEVIPGAFIGSTEFALADKAWGATGEGSSGYEFWVFQWAFAATASTIVSGAVAERTKFVGYLIYTLFITALIYPVVVHWGWAGGFLAANGFNDFAGSGIVHMTGGVAALVAAIAIGPRAGRFKPSASICGGNNLDNHGEFQPSSPTFQALGTLILWFGWYGFNPGSTVAIHDEADNRVASLAAINTTLSPSLAIVTCVIYHLIKNKCAKVELGQILNCCLGGLVGITAGCASVRPWEAAVIGILSCPVYLLSSEMLKRFKIDDPLDASPVHCFCGIWGVLAAGIFGVKDEGIMGVQIYGVLAIFAWVAVTSALVFFPLKAAGLLRVSMEDEIKGLDVSHHGAIEVSVMGKNNVKTTKLVSVDIEKVPSVEAENV